MCACRVGKVVCACRVGKVVVHVGWGRSCVHEGWESCVYVGLGRGAMELCGTVWSGTVWS